MSSLATTSNTQTAALVPRLPESAFTKSGIAFKPNEDVWVWDDGPFRVYIDFRKLGLPLSVPTDSLKRTLMVFAKSYSASHLLNVFQALVHFLARRGGTEQLSSITAAEVSNYSSTLKAKEKWRLGVLNVLLQKWVGLGLPGVESDCTDYLREFRKPGNEKGAAVRTRDPVQGPFSEAEYTTLYKAVDAAYGRGDLPRWVAVLTRLLFACGGRISQYASLKMMDFRMDVDGFALNLPQAKTREINTRVLLKSFDISPQTGRLLMEYVEDLREDGFDEDSALFPESVVMVLGHREKRRTESDLFFGHCEGAALSRTFSSILGDVAPPTERLYFQPIPITPQRFRYTFGTRMAEEGASKVVIADRLGHADLQNVDVYFEASPKIVENIDKAMGASLAPLSRAFMGKVVAGEEQSTQRGAVGSRIVDFRTSTKPLGSCAACGKGCAFNKPIACYTCFRFEPWLDAPHGKVLSRLEADRETWSHNERLAAINDDAICAVREVMAECAMAHEQRQGEDAA